MVTELLVVLALIAANGLFAGAELAILTAANGVVGQRAEAKDRRALAVLKLREQPERFLATVQIGITVVSAAAAAFGGASIAASLAPALEGTFGESAHEVAMVIVIASVSFFTLIIGELVPKSLALRYANGYAFMIGRPLWMLSRIMRPLVWLLTGCSNVVLSFFGDKTSFTESRVSRDELRELVKEAAKVGAVDQKGSEIAARALEFGDVTVAEVMVRRKLVVAVAQDATAEEVQRVLLDEGHSRIVVYDGELDRVVGYVVARDVLALAWEGQAIALADIVRPIMKVPLGMRGSAALREMQTRHIQIAIVTDEEGGTAGLVTMEDLMEELVGDILDSHEAPAEKLHFDADGAALVPGWMPTRKVNRTLMTMLPIARESTTMAGLCMTLALAVPAVGSKLASPDGSLIEVVDASPRRVRMVRVFRASRQPPPSDA